MTPAEKIIDKFGGVRRMAALMGEASGKPVPVTTVQYWKDSGRIPGPRQDEVWAAAVHHRIPLTHSDFFVDTDSEPPTSRETPVAGAA